MIKKLTEGRTLLFIAVAGSVILSLCHLFFSCHMYRDAANVYAYMARALAEGNYMEAFHDRIPHLTVLFSRVFTLAGVSPEKAVSAVSCLFYILTVPFVYLLVKEFLPEKLAGAGALLFAFAPKVIRFSCTSLIDSGKLLFFTAAVYFGYRLIKNHFRTREAFYFGIALGLLSLVRSEGIGSAASIAASIGIFYIIEAVRMKKVFALPALFTGLFMWIALAASRIVVLGLFCGKWVYDGRMNDAFANILGRPDAVPLDTTTEPCSWGHMLSQNLRGAYEPYMIFAVIGIIVIFWTLCWKKHPKPEFVRWNSFYWVFFALILVNMMIFKVSGWAAYRYFLLNIPLLMVFTLTGLYWVWLWIPRKLSQLPVILFAAAVLIAQAVNGIELSFDKKSRREHITGLILKKEFAGMNPRVHFWGFAASPWYYSGAARALPVESRLGNLETFADFDYAVCHKKDYSNMILEKRSDLQEVALPQESTVRLYRKK